MKFPSTSLKRIDWKVIICILVLIFVFEYLFYYLPEQKAKALAGIKTSGRIISKSGLKYRFDYSYQFADSTYYSSSRADNAQEYQELKLGGIYVVYVDPDDPSNSYLQRNRPIKETNDYDQ